MPRHFCQAQSSPIPSLGSISEAGPGRGTCWCRGRSLLSTPIPQWKPRLQTSSIELLAKRKHLHTPHTCIIVYSVRAGGAHTKRHTKRRGRVPLRVPCLCSEAPATGPIVTGLYCLAKLRRGIFCPPPKSQRPVVFIIRTWRDYLSTSQSHPRRDQTETAIDEVE